MKSFFRFIGKNKLYAAINIFGLAVSLMFVILIADYSVSQLDVDRFHENRDRIYLMGSEANYFSNYKLSHDLEGMYPEIDKICCTALIDMEASLNDDGKFAANCCLADSIFFEMFSFPFLEGDRNSALDYRNSVVVTESFARKMFGSTDVIGKDMTITPNDMEPFIVSISAVIKNLRKTVFSSEIDIFIPVNNSARVNKYDIRSPYVIITGSGGVNTFIMTHPAADLTAKIPAITEYMKENSYEFKYSDRKEVVFTPLTEIKLNPNTASTGLVSGNAEMLYTLIAAGLAILIFALTNYINLTVAQTGFRAKEMASRRLLGASQKGVTLRMISESTLMTVMAFVIGLALSLILQPYASTILQTDIHLLKDLSFLTVIIYILFILILGALSGIIPAYTLSRYKPIDIVKGSLRFKSKMVFSKIFLAFQNIISIVMIVAASHIYLQMDHLIKAPLGLNREGIIEFFPWSLPEDQINSFRNEVSQLACVEELGVSRGAFFGPAYSITSFIDKDGKERWMRKLDVDSNCVKILGLQLLSDNHPASECVYLNEEAANLLGIDYTKPEFSIDFGGGAEKKILGGVYKDFKTSSIIAKSYPTIITPMRPDEHLNYSNLLYIKIRGDQKAAFNSLNELFLKITGRQSEGEINFADDVVAENFDAEKRLSIMVLIFTIVAIIISTLGLFAMSTYFTQQRVKEIGLRKILGGTKKEIMSRQLWRIIRPIIISFIIAIPIAYIIISKWLEGYSYRIQISPLVFLAAGAFILIVGIATVLSKSLHAVNENPIKAIRAE